MLVQYLHLLDGLIVERDNIMGLDVCRFVLLDQHQAVPYSYEALEYRLLCRVNRGKDGGGICHVLSAACCVR